MDRKLAISLVSHLGVMAVVWLINDVTPVWIHAPVGVALTLAWLRFQGRPVFERLNKFVID